MQLDEGRSADGDEAEEYEHEKLAQTRIAIRTGPAGIEPRGRYRSRADHNQPPGRRQCEHQPERTGQRKRSERGHLDGSRLRGARPDQPERADPLRVRTSNTVAVVV